MAVLLLFDLIALGFSVANACVVVVNSRKGNENSTWVLSLSRVMAVKHYAGEYAILIKEKNYDDSTDNSDNDELEDHYPLIRQTEKDLTTILNADISKGINNGLHSSSKLMSGSIIQGINYYQISSSVSMAIVMPMSTEVGSYRILVYA
ncbi:hypothetical protein M0802_007458 [Mischocyttarus mexicanus]|nr:hypothetical protein M0802_007458 [Mischocyttarus mexicanus]